MVPERWKQQYFLDGRWGATILGSTEAIYNGLKALDLETATATEVEAIIGNGSWSHQRCNECGEYAVTVVEIGAPEDYESSTAHVCEPCMRKAIALFEAAASANEISK
jgi:hypothetical protein